MQKVLTSVSTFLYITNYSLIYVLDFYICNLKHYLICFKSSKTLLYKGLLLIWIDLYFTL
jgi:hypothetical protein